MKSQIIKTTLQKTENKNEKKHLINRFKKLGFLENSILKMFFSEEKNPIKTHTVQENVLNYGITCVLRLTRKTASLLL